MMKKRLLVIALVAFAGTSFRANDSVVAKTPCARNGVSEPTVQKILAQREIQGRINQTIEGAEAKSRRERVRQVLEDFRTTSGFPGAIAGVYYADGTSFAVAVGYSDRERKTPMKETDLMHGGSVGKTLFAALALQLVAEGRLSLDDKISKYLGNEPWFAGLPNAGTITVRMLLNHTSGLPGYGDVFMRVLVESPGKEHSPLDAVKSISGAKPLNAAGAAFSYSDINYQVLAFVIEHVTGRSAYDDIRRRILKSLHLKRIVPADRPKIPGLVPGYAGAKNPFGGDKMLVNGALTFDPRFEWGGGGFVTNPRDLARWIANFCEGRAFSRKLLPEVLTTVDAPELGQGSRSALGVEVELTPLGEAYGHGGFFPGYFTQVRWYPRERIAIAIQINTSDNSLVKRSLKDVVDDLAKAAL
jgi:D-alanyl-D-alanine carboxypeptidase